MGQDSGAQGARRVISTIISCCLLLFGIAVILTIGVTVFLVLWFTHSAGLNPENTDPPSYTSLPSQSPSRSPTQSFSSSISFSGSTSLSPSSSLTPSLTKSPSLTPSVSTSASNTPSISITASNTPSISSSASITPTISVTPSRSGTISVTPSVSQSRPSTTSTASISGSISVTPSVTPTISTTNTASTTRSISASATPQPYTLSVSTLTPAQGYPIYGSNPGDKCGGTVSLSGDINQDGTQDFLIGCYGNAPNGSGTGYSFLVYSKTGYTSLDLQQVTAAQGSRFNNANDNPYTWLSVSSAGDFNSDGYQDIFIGAEGASAPPTGSLSANGEGYIVYGKQGGIPSVSLASLGTAGTQVYGAGSSDFSHNSIDGGRDLNGDNITDLVIGAWKTTSNTQAGGMYTLYGGKNQPSTINLAGSYNGYMVRSAVNIDYCGSAVAVAGDFNQDGSQDSLMGCYYANNLKGGAYVIYGGSTGTGTVNVTNIATSSAFIGNNTFDALGSSLTRIGDFNRDGVDDILLGAPGASGAVGGYRYQSGIGYVVYGRPGGYGQTSRTIQSLAATEKLEIWGVKNSDKVSTSVSSAGDVNGDGIPDIILGSPAVNSGNGAAYVIFGKSGFYSGGVIDLQYLTADVGFTIAGASGEGFGKSVASAGDVNGDGYGDVLIGASNASPKGRTNAGTTYVIYGKRTYP